MELVFQVYPAQGWNGPFSDVEGSRFQFQRDPTSLPWYGSGHFKGRFNLDNSIFLTTYEHLYQYQSFPCVEMSRCIFEKGPMIWSTPVCVVTLTWHRCCLITIFANIANNIFKSLLFLTCQSSWCKWRTLCYGVASKCNCHLEFLILYKGTSNWKELNKWFNAIQSGWQYKQRSHLWWNTA